MTTPANPGGARNRTVRPGRKMIEAVGTSSVNVIIQHFSECCSYDAKVSSFSDSDPKEHGCVVAFPPPPPPRGQPKNKKTKQKQPPPPQKQQTIPTTASSKTD